jgi:oxygen-independent coproporphyrinogen-3 oxidase
MTAACGLYVHVPFCRSKCAYCDFYSRPPREGEMDRFVDALGAELAARAADRVVDTVYLGGGTPSLLGPARIARILEDVRRLARPAEGAEISLEANPLDVTERWAKAVRAAGVNRLSLGVQSPDADELDFLGRLHIPADGPCAAVAARKAGFENLGIDLIYGLPGQTPARVEKRLRAAVERCRPQHVSAYQLTYAPETPLGREVEAGDIRPPGEDEACALFLRVHEVLEDLGFPAYEVSNFAPADRRSRHNSHMWQRRPYIGLGPAAHSFLPPARSWNACSVTDYLDAVEAGRSAEAGHEELTDAQEAVETILLGLRTADGLDRPAFRARFGWDVAEARRDAVAAAVKRGQIEVSPERIRPTRQGLAVADRLAAELA